MGNTKHQPDDDMKLPEGKSCTDCAHFSRCVRLIGKKWINDQATGCDWSPSRFREKKEESRGPRD
jgi:hypothetical protein